MPRQFGVPEEIVRDVMAGRRPPSDYSPYMTAVHDKHVIGINNAYMLGTWIDIVFFGDYNWYLVHRKRLAEFPNLKVSCAARIGSIPYEGVKYLPRDVKKTSGISTDPTTVCWNNNSGAAAISLARHLGVRRVLLLGFDMSLDANHVSHWHGSHNLKRPVDLKSKLAVFDRHLRGFAAIARDAKQCGMEILNVSPDSAIVELKKVRLEEVLG